MRSAIAVGKGMSWAAQQLLSGVLLGGYYALLACGLSFMFGVMRIINLAHGDLAVVAAFLVFLIRKPKYASVTCSRVM